MKRCLSFLLVVTLLAVFAAGTASAAEGVSYAVDPGDTVAYDSSGAGRITVTVSGGNLPYAVAQFKVRLGDNVGISKVSYDVTNTGDLETMPPAQSTTENNVWYFSLMAKSDNGLDGDLVCNIDFVYSGSGTGQMVIEEIKKGRILSPGNVQTFIGGSTVISLVPDEGQIADNYYDITTVPVTGAAIQVGIPVGRPTMRAAAGDVISLDLTLENGYEFERWSVSRANGNTVALSSETDATSFVMPAENVRISVAVKNVQEGQEPGNSGNSGNVVGGGGSGGGTLTEVTISESEAILSALEGSDPSKFTDMENHWAKIYVEYMESRGFVNGKTENTFAPNDPITRGEFVVILARMSGDDLPEPSDVFEDVQAHMFYAKSVAWAVKAGVTRGTSPTSFSPNDKITRQDIATMIVRYAQYKSIAFAQTNAPLSFTDETQIDSYAKEAVNTMQRAGIINGYADGTFLPKNHATRAESVKMLALMHSAMG